MQRSIGLSHENALAPHSDWVSFWASLINWAGLHDIFWGRQRHYGLGCLFFFFLSSSYEWERVNGLLSALLLKNKYPAICSNYDDLQESGNTHPPIWEGGQGMISKAIWGGGGGGTIRARQIPE